MGLKIRQHKRGWWQVDIHVRLPSGIIHRERKKSPGATEAAAVRWGEARMRHILQHGVAPAEAEPEKPEVPTLAEFEADFIEKHDRANRRKHSTIETKLSVFRNHLVPALGDKRLDEITTADVQALKSRLAAAAPKTVNNVLAILKTCLRVARDWGIADAPAKIELVKTADPEMQFYEPEDFERLLAAAARVDPRAALVVLLAGEAGLRQGEVIALEQRDVDHARKLLTVQRSEWRGVVAVPKGGRSRKVTLTARLEAALADVRHLRGDRVLYRDDGTKATPRTLRTWLESAARIAGIGSRTGAIHVLRHTFGARLAMQGAPAKAIQELMGHASLTTTLRYMHLSPAARDAAIRLLETGAGAKTGKGTATGEVKAG